jgi:RNA polymerase sigma-70 factor (ECF subfamily)
VGIRPLDEETVLMAPPSPEAAEHSAPTRSARDLATAELVARAQAGDRDALAQVIAEQQSYVYSIALSLMKRPEDAADLTQDAFVRLCGVISSYRGETKFTTWLYRLVKNLGLDTLRRRGRRDEASFEDDEIDVRDEDPVIDPPTIADRHETASRVRAALDGLPTAYRLALTLYYFRELKYEEIATVLDLPLNTVKAHIRRGKLALAGRLGEWELREAT